MFYIAVYGTLKKDCSNHKFLFKSKFIKEIEIKGSLYLKKDNSRYFPHLILDNQDKVTAELYQVSKNALKFIDNLEGHPDFFERKEIKINNFDENIFIYEYKLQKNEDLERDFIKIKEFKGE